MAKQRKKMEGKQSVIITEASKNNVDLMKKFYPDKEVTKESIGPICTDDSIKTAHLKNVPLDSKFIINDHSLITLIDDSTINYLEIIDLTHVDFDADNKFLFALDFIGWITILEEQIFSVSSNAQEARIKFISANELKISFPIKCSSVKEGYNRILDMHETVNKRGDNLFDEFCKKYGLKRLEE